MLTYFFIGLAIGAITGIPIGPVNVAVIDAAYRHNLRRAVAVGLGGAIGDSIYALLGIVGMGPFLERHPSVPPVLYAFSGAVLLIYGVLTARSPALPAVDVVPKEPEPAGHFWSGLWLGLALIILNPAAIITWVVVVGSSMLGVTTSEGLAATVGVGLGSVAWFTLVAYLAHHGKKLLGGKAVWITRGVGYLLIAYALFSIGRAVYYWI